MAKYNQVSSELLKKLKEVLGDKYVSTAPDKLEAYQTDEEGNSYYFRKPEVVVFPGSTEDVAAVVKLANQYLVPITPRSAGSGVACGAIPIYHGIVMELERMNKILKIDEDNLYAVVQTGVRTNDMQQEAKQRGLLYAGDPCSSDSCQIGGNVATNAGGNKAVRYGTTRNQIYCIKMVTGEGEIVTLGARLQKKSTGYAVEELIYGSEGTLGIITEITLKLRPLPPHKIDLVAVFTHDEEALLIPNKIIKAGIEPTSIEFMDNKAINACGKYIKVDLPYAKEDGVYVIVTIETFDEEELDRKTEKLNDLCEANGAIEVLMADDRIWSARRNIAEAARDIDKMYIAEDFVVPLDKIVEIIKILPILEKKHGMSVITAAHIGDGNMHPLLLNTQNVSPEEWVKKVEAFHGDLFPIVYEFGGRLSGEHGIGYKKMHDFKIYTDPVERKLMMKIKEALDPNTILNPAKIFDLNEGY